MTKSKYVIQYGEQHWNANNIWDAIAAAAAAAGVSSHTIRWRLIRRRPYLVGMHDVGGCHCRPNDHVWILNREEMSFPTSL